MDLLEKERHEIVAKRWLLRRLNIAEALLSALWVHDDMELARDQIRNDLSGAKGLAEDVLLGFLGRSPPFPGDAHAVTETGPSLSPQEQLTRLERARCALLAEHTARLAEALPDVIAFRSGGGVPPAELVDDLELRYGWTAQEALEFLTDSTAPTYRVGSVNVERVIGTGPDKLGITMRLRPWLSPGTVARAYADAQRRLYGLQHHHRPPSTKAVNRLRRILATRSTGTTSWPELHRRHGRDYATWRGLRYAVERLRRAVFEPRYAGVPRIGPKR